MMRWMILLPALLLGLATTTPLPAQVVEICDNGIDDDGDGLIDCVDDDCFFPLISDSGQALGNSYSFGVALGDLDGDGDLDAWVANSNQPNRVWINDGLGNFTDSGQALGNSDSTDVAIGDLDAECLRGGRWARLPRSRQGRGAPDRTGDDRQHQQCCCAAPDPVGYRARSARHAVSRK